MSKNKILMALSVILFAIGAIYTTSGAYTLISEHSVGTLGIGDLGMRWREQQYLIHGINPYDVSAQFTGVDLTTEEIARIADGHLSSDAYLLPSGYPPWGLAASFLFVFPASIVIAKWFFVFLCLAAVSFTSYYAYRVGRRVDNVSGLFMGSVVFAMFSNASTLRLGQYGLLLNAIILLALLCETGIMPIRVGILMALSSIKPSFSLLQIFLLITRKEWISLMCVGSICILASTVPWYLSGVNPVEMTLQMLRQSGHVSEGDVGFLGIARHFVAFSSASSVLLLSGILVTVVIGWIFRNDSLLVSVSVAATMGRLCIYHRQYDNVMLYFLILALGSLALQVRTYWAWAVFAITGLTVWLPIPLPMYTNSVIVTLAVVWISACMVLCYNADRVPVLTWGNKEIR